MKKHFCPYCMTAVVEGEPCPSCGLTALAYDPSPHHLPPGTILMDRYIVGRVLGEGGFGITYIGCDLRLEMKVAIKEYFPSDKVTRHAMASLDVTSYMGDAAVGYEEGKVRFLNEARTMARMDKQPEIVSVRDFFEDHNTAYIVMEYVNGTTFKELVSQKGGRIPVEELLPMMEPLFSALAAMHEIGLIHRDISPDNLMLEKGALRLLDFGCARESSHGTETMTIALKHGFAPIEQYQHKGQGPWTDVYALSATIYYCLTGKHPQQALDRMCEDELVFPRFLGVNITPRQEAALLYGMGIRPRRRFQSVQELYAALYQEAPVPPAFWDEYWRVIDERQIGDNGKDPESKEQDKEKTSDQEPKKLSPAENLGRADASALAFLKKHRRAAAISSAALLLILALALILPTVLTSGGDQTDDGNDTQTNLTDRTDDPDQTDGGAKPVWLSEPDGEKLRSLLADGSVSEIIIKDTSILLTGDALVINKPVRLTQDSGFNFMSPVLIGEGGSLEINGSMWSDGVGLLRCMDGGSVHVSATGGLYGNLAWLDDAADLTVEEGGEALFWNVPYGENEISAYLIFREEELFANAVHVSSLEDYRRAMGNMSVSSVVIDGDLTLSEGCIATKPVLISEGVTIYAESPEAPWEMEGTLMINRGTIKGFMNTFDGRQEAKGAVVNYGTIDACMGLNASGPFINSGEIVTGSACVIGSCIFNLGTFTCVEMTDCAVELYLGVFINSGKLVIDGTNCRMTLGNGIHAANSGEIEVKNGTFEVETVLSTCGSITVWEDADLDGSGMIEQTTTDASLKLLSDYKTQVAGEPFCGLLTYNMSSTVDTAWPIGRATIAFDWVSAGPVWEKGVCDAANEDAFRKALENPSCHIITVSGDLALEGDVVLTKGLAVSGTLTVHGNLTVLGGGYVVSAPITVDGDITVSDGGVWVNRDNITCKTMTIGANGHFYHTNGRYDMEKLRIDGGFFTGCRWMELGDLEVELNGMLLSLGGLNVYNSEIDLLHEDSQLTVFMSGYNFAGDVTIENHGVLDLIACYWQEAELDAYVTNRGQLSLRDGASIGGTIDNTGTMDVYGRVPVRGAVHNSGKIRVGAECEGLVEEGGRITGNPQSYR